MNTTILANNSLNFRSARSDRSAQALILPEQSTLTLDTPPPPSLEGRTLTQTLALVAGAGAQATPCPTQQVRTVQSHDAAAELLQTHLRSQPEQMHFFIHIGITGEDIEISRDQALERIESSMDVIFRTQHAVPVSATLNSAVGPTQVTFTSWQDTHIQNLEKLRQLLEVQKKADQVSQSETEHLTKVLRSYNGVHGDFLYQMREVEDNDGPGLAHIKDASELSPFEGASELLAGHEVAFIATPVSQVVEAASQGQGLEHLRGEIELISNQEDLLSLPQSFDAAREAWHPRIPGGDPVEWCWYIQEGDHSTFHCEQGIIRPPA